LLGLYPATYDFAAAATVDTDYIAPQAIIHLHGQGTGKSLLNSDEETKEHAENIRPLIHATFQDSPLLVIGYSGSSDAVFPVIADEYKGRERLWWAGYAEDPDAQIANLINKNSKLSYYLGECDADEFLIELAKELNCFPPTLFSDPYGHLLSELAPVADFPLTKSGSSDLLTALKNELIESQQRFNSDQNIPELMMRGEWEKVIQLGDPKNPEHKENLAWAYTMSGNETAGKALSRQDESLYQQSFNKFEQAIAIKPDIHEAFNNWGIALNKLAQLKSDELLFQQSFDKYQKAITIKPEKYEAFINWGNALLDLAKLKNDESLFQQSFNKYRQAISIKPDSHDAFHNWGIALSELAQLKGDESLFQQSFDKYQQAFTIKPDMHDVFHNWGIALHDLAKLKGDESLFEQSIEKYQQATTIKPDAHDALHDWGLALSYLAKLKGDESLFEQSMKKYQQAIVIKPDFHEAFNNWGNTLLDLAKLKGDESLFQQSFNKYQEAIAINPTKYDAFHNCGIALIGTFQLTKNKDYLDRAAEILERAEALNPDKVYNSACLYSLLNEKDKCKEKLWHCYNVKTLPDKAHLSNDRDLDNVRSEPWFEELINSIN
jgi:tetratricopeptide (TPR) repeat protein